MHVVTLPSFYQIPVPTYFFILGLFLFFSTFGGGGAYPNNPLLEERKRVSES